MEFTISPELLEATDSRLACAERQALAARRQVKKARRRFAEAQISRNANRINEAWAILQRAIETRELAQAAFDAAGEAWMNARQYPLPEHCYQEV